MSGEFGIACQVGELNGVKIIFRMSPRKPIGNRCICGGIDMRNAIGVTDNFNVFRIDLCG